MKNNVKKGIIVIISGPSGVGKSTICNEIIKRLDDAYLSVSATTRKKAPGEIEGKDYFFVTEQQFQQWIEQGLFLEYAKVFDYMYGTLKDKTDEALDAGKIVILEIDVQGARQVKTIYHDAVMIFILPPSQKTLVERINFRARDDDETAEKRLGGANQEIAAAFKYYDNMVINEDLQQAVDEVVNIIQNKLQDASQINNDNIGEQ